MTTTSKLRSLAGAAIATALAAMSAAAQDLEQITFAQPSPSAINSYPVFVAIGEGYFAEEGLEVTVEAVNGSASVLQAMAAG
ncbi:MAG: ABC transporter substrate-binding protein, partial [Geminicoccaceae bacterium]